MHLKYIVTEVILLLNPEFESSWLCEWETGILTALLYSFYGPSGLEGHLQQ